MDVSEKFEKLGKRFMSQSSEKRQIIRSTILYLCHAVAENPKHCLNDQDFYDNIFIESPSHSKENLSALQHIFEFGGVKIQDREPFAPEATPYSNCTSLMSLLNVIEVKRDQVVLLSFRLLGCDDLVFLVGFNSLLIDLPCIQLNESFKRIKSHSLDLTNDDLALRNTILFFIYSSGLPDKLLAGWVVTREASQLIENIVNAYTHTASESEKLQIEAALAHFLRALRNNKEWELRWKDFETQWLEDLADISVEDHNLPMRELVSKIEETIIKHHSKFLNMETRKQFDIGLVQNGLVEISESLICWSIAFEKEKTEVVDKINTFWCTIV